jgi:ArsR family transcriptional regulator
MKTLLGPRQIERICKALGDPYRMKIVEMVRRDHDWTQCVAVIEEINLAQSTVSHHLKQLVDADILIGIKEGRNTKYQINKEVLNDFVGYLQHLSK